MAELDLPTRILAILQECTTRPGASKQEIEQLTKSLDKHLPSDYLALLAYSNGMEGCIGDNYLNLWPIEQVRLYGVYEHVPFLVFIGSDGGGEGFAYDTRSPELPIVNAPFIGSDVKNLRVLGMNIVDFLERLKTRPLF